MPKKKQNEFRKGQSIKFRASSLATTDQGRGKGLQQEQRKTLVSGTVVGFQQQGGDVKLKVRLSGGSRFEMLIHPSQVV